MVHAFSLWLCIEEKDLKILLIRPRPHRETIGLQSVMICEPLELMQLAAVLRANHHEVQIVDMILEKKALEHFIHEFEPQLVGITGYISHIGIMKEYARRIKKIDENILVAVGGVHATVCPEDFSCESIDCVARSAEDLYKLAKCQDTMVRYADRSLPSRYTDKYYYLFADKCALIKTSFGCPYNCNFCFCKEISSYQARAIDDVITELLQIPQKEVYIVDDDFLFNRDRLLEFAAKLKENKIEKNFLVYGRADFIAANEDIIEALSQVGLGSVIVGIEAASQNELDQFNKRSKLEDNEKAVRILRKHDIECYATVILGVDWDKSDFRNLYRYLKRLGLVFVNLQPFTPMPGTPYFYQYQNRLIIPYEEHEKWDMAHLVIKPEKVSVGRYYFEILKLYYKITLMPRNVVYMFKRYGVRTTLKLSLGAGQISWQYIKKMVGGSRA
jgi:radical SAM superfamily enzyme YgiQ (UPF0313 family)